MSNRIPVTKRSPGAPYFGPTLAKAGKRVARVIAATLPCECRQYIVRTHEAFTVENGVTLDATPTADGAYVVVENATGSQKVIPFDPAKHAGWSRYDAHVCAKKEGTP